MGSLAALIDHDGVLAPWVDLPDYPSAADRRVASGVLSDDERAQLDFWRENGYLALPGAISPEAVDALRADYEQAWTDGREVPMLIEGIGVTTVPEAPERDTLTHHHYRFMDFHEHSAPARDVMFDEQVTTAIGNIFGERPVAMQSLLFEYGSEQTLHQDFPYVVAQRLSHLVGCWIALDDVDDENGPLFYYPGSHRLPAFDWGSGEYTFTGSGDTMPKRFAEHLTTAAGEAGLERVSMSARKGDVLLWHSSLAHGGSPVIDTSRSRLSLVAHFSTSVGYPVDRRFPAIEPIKVELGGAVMYEQPEVAATPAEPPTATAATAASSFAEKSATLARRALGKARRIASQLVAKVRK